MKHPSEIPYEVPCDGTSASLPYLNLWRDLFHQRDLLFQNPIHPPYLGNTLTLFYPQEVVVGLRQSAIERVSYFRQDNILWMRLRVQPGDPPIKENTKLIWTPNTLLLVLNQQKRDVVPEERTSEDLRRQALLTHAIKQSIINVFRRYSSKPIYLSGNDILVDRAKIFGGETIEGPSQYHEHGVLIWKYEPEIFTPLLTDDKNHQESISKRGTRVNAGINADSSFTGLTGIANEIQDLSKEAFTGELLVEINTLLAMAHSSLYE